MLKPSRELAISVTSLELSGSQPRLSWQVLVIVRLGEEHAHSLENDWGPDEPLFPRRMDLFGLWQKRSWFYT